MSAIYMAVNSWTGTLGCGNIVKAELPRLNPQEAARRELACARLAVAERVGKRRCLAMHDDEVLKFFDRLHR